MIYDKENAFLFNEPVTNTPAIIGNGKGGNAYNELFLTAKFTAPLDKETTVTLKTGSAADLSDGKVLANLTIPAGKQNGTMRIPFGSKEYYGISIAGTTAGKCTVALTLDGDLD